MRIPRLLQFALASSVFVCSHQILQAQQHTSGPPSEKAMVNAYRGAHDRRDVSAAMKLYCWDGVTDKTRRLTEWTVKDHFDDKLISITMTSEHPKGRPNQSEFNGKTYRFNLPVVKELVVTLAMGKAADQMTFFLPVGVKDGKYLIAQMAPTAK